MSADQEANKEAVYRSMPEPWEVGPDWEREVAAPCRRHMLAPRDARAILEVAGQLADRGIRAEVVVRLLEGYRDLYRTEQP